MTTTYMIDYIWNGNGCHVKGVITEAMLAEVQDDPKHKIVSLEPYTPVIRYKVAEGCFECGINEYVAHYNCRCRNKRAHCTADSCF